MAEEATFITMSAKAKKMPPHSKLEDIINSLTRVVYGKRIRECIGNPQCVHVNNIRGGKIVLQIPSELLSAYDEICPATTQRYDESPRSWRRVVNSILTHVRSKRIVCQVEWLV